MNKLMAAVDFSRNTDCVLEQALRLAKATGAKLWILHVASNENQMMAYQTSQFTADPADLGSIPSDVQLTREVCAHELKREHSDLLAISANLRSKGADAQAILMQGSAARQIIEKAADLDVDIVLLGSHGHGLLHKVMLGSVSESVIKNAPCNVMIVPTPQ